MPDRHFLNEILDRIARAGWRRRGAGDGGDPIACFDRVLDATGEALALVTAREALDSYDRLPEGDRPELFRRMQQRYCADVETLERAIRDWTPGDAAALRRLHAASEPASRRLIARLNMVPGATARLVRMRADLLRALRDDRDLKPLDTDFLTLLGSWFNRGFLELRRIDWNTPAAILERIIAYEAVHAITGWDDLRQRVADRDRRLFAFFHPAMPADPLIFVEVALLDEIPAAIGPILSADRTPLAPDAASVAAFYSISNCHPGLRGISFGNFLIKQVVAELQAELPGLKRFVTLSPVPGLRRWAEQAAEAGDPLLPAPMAEAIRQGQTPDDSLAARIAARYLLNARRPQGTAYDPVAHFHLGNGASLYRINPGADGSENGLRNSWGVMVNYLYDEKKIETNHQAYTADGRIIAAPAVRALAEKG